MIRNLFFTALRNLRKNKFFSMLNILGLSIGMTVFLLIAQYVMFESSYENFVPNNENIYRVKLETYSQNELIAASAENYPGVGPALKNELPEVKSYARLYNMGYKNNVIITYENGNTPIAFKQRKFLYADSSFLSMMDYPMLKGDKNTALAEPFTVVISEKCAQMYFGKEDPIGKLLHLQDDDFNNELVKVTGVFKDLPLNTHLKFDILFSYKTLLGRFPQAPVRYGTGWIRKDMYVFIQLQPGTDPKKVEAKFASIVEKYKPELKQTSQRDILSLQPLSAIHLTSNLAEEPEPNGNSRTVFFLALIGFFVLVIAWINYINLSTGRALERAKEVGIRKVIGAFKRQLVIQFLTESALVNLVSIIISWALVALSLSYFNELSGLSLGISYLAEPWFLILLLLVWLSGSLLSGIYPALVLSSFKPVTVLKGKLKHDGRGIALRNTLVVVQFMASIVLIIGTIIVYRQLDYMQSRDMGMNIDQVLVVERPGISDTSRKVNNASIDVFRNELTKNSAIQGVAASLTIPGKQREYKTIIKKFGSAADSIIARVNTMDYNFIDVFKMKLIAGRNFSKEFPKDENSSVILTESAAHLLGYKTPAEAIGKVITMPEFDTLNFDIVGVVNDYNQLSLKKALDPTLFNFSPYYAEFYSMRIKTDNVSQTLKHVQEAWERAFPGNPFEYFFLDDYFNRQYESDRKFGKLFTTFAILAIFIGCLGLFGLSAYTANQRIREIGIRKVLGASVADITVMLSKDFIKLVAIAILIACPIAWWVMNSWLQDFAYRIEIGWWVFVAAGGIALFIAVFTVSFQAIKAAVMNPVKSLRME